MRSFTKTSLWPAILFVLNALTAFPVLAQAPSTQQEFGDLPGQYYTYAPSYIQASPTERYMYNCRNCNSGEVKDYISVRKATLSNGVWTWGNPQCTLAPGSNSNDWDSRHVCDPEVRKGNFTYNGTTYSWVMFYLGVRLSTDTQNQIGIAFANNPEGPWVKYANNPVITAPYSTTDWGTGQPAATSVDGQGRFLLYYTRSTGGNAVYRRDINLSNMASPNLGTEVKVFTTGLTDRDGQPTTSLQGAAFAYEPSTDRTYMIRGHLPFVGDYPGFISSELEIAYTSGASIWNNSGTWTVDGRINPDNSGRERNFDAGFLTDAYGVLLGGASNYQPSFAVSDIGSNALWTYRMYRINKADLITGPGLTLVPGGVYELAPKHALGMRLNETGTVPNADADIYTSNNSSGQRWKLINDGGGYYQLEPQQDISRRLDVSGAGTINSTNVAVWYENGNDAQKWKVIDVGGGYYELEPKHAPGKRLDVGGAAATNNSNVYLWDQNGNNAQKWKLILKTNGARKGYLNLENTPLSPAFTVHPNPSSGKFVVTYQPRQTESLSLQLYSNQGQLVQKVFEGEGQAGIRQQHTVEGRGLLPGIYLLKLHTPTGSQYQKVLLSR